MGSEKKPCCIPLCWLVRRDPHHQWPLYSKIPISSIVSSKVQTTRNVHCSNVILPLSTKHGKAEHGSVSVSLGKVDPGILRVHVNASFLWSYQLPRNVELYKHVASCCQIRKYVASGFDEMDCLKLACEIQWNNDTRPVKTSMNRHTRLPTCDLVFDGTVFVMIVLVVLVVLFLLFRLAFCSSSTSEFAATLLSATLCSAMLLSLSLSLSCCC